MAATTSNVSEDPSVIQIEFEGPFLDIMEERKLWAFRYFFANYPDEAALKVRRGRESGGEGSSASLFLRWEESDPNLFKYAELLVVQYHKVKSQVHENGVKKVSAILRTKDDWDKICKEKGVEHKYTDTDELILPW